MAYARTQTQTFAPGNFDGPPNPELLSASVLLAPETPQYDAYETHETSQTRLMPTVVQISKGTEGLDGVPDMWKTVRYREMPLGGGTVEARHSLHPTSGTELRARFMIRAAMHAEDGITVEEEGFGHLLLPRLPGREQTQMRMQVGYKRMEHPDGLTIYTLFGLSDARKLALASQ